MRVVHVSPTAFGAEGLFGGGERYPVELVRALRRRVDCRLVTFGSQRRCGADTVVLEPPARYRGHPVHPVPRGLLRELRGADVVHVHHMRALPSVVATVAALGRRQRRFVTDHGLGAGRGPQVLQRLFDGFLTVSRYSAGTLRAPADKTTVVYGGVDTDRFRPDGDTGRAGVLFVGRLTPHKGVDRLIRALPEGTSLTIAGTGGHDRRPPERDYASELQRMAAGRDVRFAGRVADDELPALYRSARVFVLPSVNVTCYGKPIRISELFGLSLAEAMASGTPVVATRVGGVPEVVVDGQTGFVVEPGDVGAMLDRIARLLTDDALAARMGAHAREHVLRNFTWDAVADRCVAAYERAIGAA